MKEFSFRLIRPTLFVALVYTLAHFLGKAVTSFCEFLFKSSDVSIEALEQYQRALNLSIYVSLILVCYFYLKSKEVSVLWIIKPKASWKIIALAPVVALLYRVVEDPLLRIELLIEGSESIAQNQYSYQRTELISMFLEYVVLSSILEEVVFRRITIGLFFKKSLFQGVIVSSILFVLKHVILANNSPDIAEILTIFTFSTVASILYLRLGLFSAILFHSSYNLIWMVLRLNRNSYIELIQYLDFGMVYWIIIIVSIVLLWMILNRIAGVVLTFLKRI